MQGIPQLILLLGGIIILTILLRPALQRIGIPSMVGFLIIGILIRFADSRWTFIGNEFANIFNLLSTVGVIFLLFRVGLESNLVALKSQIKKASVIGISNVAVSGGLGYVISHFLLGLDLVPSLFVSIALTATSVAVSVGVWEKAKALRSPMGQLLVDVAELDDITGVIFMAVLFSVTPILISGQEAGIALLVGKEVGLLLAKLSGFIVGCLLFSRYVEERITKFMKKFEPIPGQTIALIGGGFVIAAIAGIIGFSVAIGAFFAGLVFNRDPQTVKLETPFEIFYEFFIPFFFINIGMNVVTTVSNETIVAGTILLAIAILGKVLGAGGPLISQTGWRGALTFGFSMVPRAEIAMVIMQRGLMLGDGVVSKDLFTSMVIVSLGTTIISPIVVSSFLKRWPQPAQVDGHELNHSHTD
jgi:Kef-type K+ transport system membrane component KefB